MAQLLLNRSALQHNFSFLKHLFDSNDIQFAIVSKLLCGTKSFIQELLALDVYEIADSRISNLEKVKRINSKTRTIYIKPPAKKSISKVIQFADVSCNSEFKTICWLNEEAKKQQKQHEIIIMIEMGDLREGVMGDDLLSFYEQVFELSNIHVIGLGTNLNCLNGVMPSVDKLIQLGLYSKLIEAKFNRLLPILSGGTSVTLPLLLNNQIPKSINHFRIGETLFFGNNLFSREPIAAMRQDVLTLKAEIIEVTEKPKMPFGELGFNPSGEVFNMEENDVNGTAKRIIVDIGVLDVIPDLLFPIDSTITIIVASSDMLILEVPFDSKYTIGDMVSFQIEYMAALRLLNSYYVEKIIIDDN